MDMGLGMQTHYDTLNIQKDAPIEVIKASYKALAQKWHPDRHQDNKEHAEIMFKKISAAYEVLSDPEKRKRYDDYLSSFDEDHPKEASGKNHKDDRSVYNEISKADRFKFKIVSSGDASLSQIIFLFFVPWLFLTALIVFIAAWVESSNGENFEPFFYACGAWIMVLILFSSFAVWKSGRTRNKLIYYPFSILFFLITMVFLFQPYMFFVDARYYYSHNPDEYEKTPHYSNAETEKELRQAARLGDLNDVVSLSYKKYPGLNPANQFFNQPAINDVISIRDQLISEGYSPQLAIAGAVLKVANDRKWSSPEDSYRKQD